MEEREHYYLIGLLAVSDIGNAHTKGLIDYFGSASHVFHTKSSELEEVPGISEKIIRNIFDRHGLKASDEIMTQCQKNEIALVSYRSKKYPDPLRGLYNGPALLYYKGSESLNTNRTMAIVGTRQASDYGKSITKKIIEDGHVFQATLLSGLAYGIDIEAHKAALQNHMPNWAILAGGIDQIYPRAHMKFAEKIMGHEGLISEQPPGTKSAPYLFPMRNRIIAGMSDVTIVVEAAVRGGALITAQIADSYNRLVLAVPGNLDRPYSMGCNQLIQAQKALIYTGAETLAYNLNWSSKKGDHPGFKTIKKNLTPAEKIIYDLLLTADYMSIDELSIKAKIEMNQMAHVLMALEFKDLITVRPGNKYELK